MKTKDLHMVLRVVAKGVKEYIAAVIANRDARLQALEARLAELEAQPLLKNAGIWRHGVSYRPGDVAQFKSSRWVCTQEHTANESPDHACWQLWEKTYRERDARS